MQKEDIEVHWAPQRTSATIAEEVEQIAQGCGWADVWDGGSVRECVAGEE